mgnify:CR=1 FL=1
MVNLSDKFRREYMGMTREDVRPDEMTRLIFATGNVLPDATAAFMEQTGRDNEAARAREEADIWTRHLSGLAQQEAQWM